MSILRRSLPFLILPLVLCTGASAADDQKKDETRNRISVALSIGAFFPRSSATRDEFGSTWTRVSLTSFDRVKPEKWRFTAEAGTYGLNSERDVRLIPITFGAERGLKPGKNAQQYVTLRAGPYFGRVEQLDGTTDSNVGLNVNAAYGVIFKERLYAEVRYDYFTKTQDIAFDGLSLSVGVRLFDIKM